MKMVYRSFGATGLFFLLIGAAQAVPHAPMSEAQLREMARSYGRDLNAWYPVRERCGDGDQFRGSNASVRSRIQAVRAAANAFAAAVQEVSSVNAAQPRVHVRFASSTFTDAATQMSVPVHDSAVTGMDTIMLAQDLAGTLSQAQATSAAIAGRVSGARTEFGDLAAACPAAAESLGTSYSQGQPICVDPLGPVTRASSRVSGALGRLRSAIGAAQSVVACRRAEQEIDYVAYRTARGIFEASGDLPNTLDGSVTIGDNQCSNSQAIAAGIPALVSGVNDVLLADRSVVERSVISQWVAEVARRHHGSTDGMGDRMNDFFARLNAKRPDAPAVASTSDSNLQGGQGQAIEP